MNFAKVYWDKEIKIALLVFIAILFLIAILLLCYELFVNRNDNFLFKNRYRRHTTVYTVRKYENEKVYDFIKENTGASPYKVRRLVTYKNIKSYTSTIPEFLTTPSVYEVKHVVTYKPSTVLAMPECSSFIQIEEAPIVRKVFRKQ